MRPARVSVRWSRPSPIAFSGQPENKATPASIAPYEYVFRGFALSRKPTRAACACLVGAGSPSMAAHGYLFADNADLEGMAILAQILHVSDDLAEYKDFRRRRLSCGVLQTATASTPACSSDRHATQATGTWSRVCLGPMRSLTISAACCCRANRSTGSPMPVRSSAPASGLAATRSVKVSSAGARTAAEIGSKLNAGTNCGSCIPELKQPDCAGRASNSRAPQPLAVGN